MVPVRLEHKAAMVQVDVAAMVVQTIFQVMVVLQVAGEQWVIKAVPVEMVHRDVLVVQAELVEMELAVLQEILVVLAVPVHLAEQVVQVAMVV